MTNYAGIDYSLEQSNVDKETGIHFGVINQNEVLQAWADSSVPEYAPRCPYCGNEIAETYEAMIEMESCPKCNQEFGEGDFDLCEPASYFLDDGEYMAECSDDGDIFITKSPYYTYCQYCSPCAPGTGYIMHTVENGAKTYCFGHDWFDDDKAPYPVFSVETGELIPAPEDTPSNHCSSCEACVINGVYCHETGCPDSWKDERRECKWCGLTFTPKEKHQWCCCDECFQDYNN